jgi:hypothetical protein
MKKLSTFSLHLIAAAATLLSTQHAHAVKYGIAPSTAPGAPAIVNPFTGQATDAWKLVGYNNVGCSAFQITREWVMTAKHCSFDTGSTNPFSNHLGASSVVACFTQETTDDMQLCRLKNPENLTAATSYPPLAVAPSFNRNTAPKFGSLMVYGRSGQGDGLAFAGFDGLPYGFNPALAPNTPAISFPVGGDSGGAVYWYSPTSTAPVMVGVLVSGTPLQYSAFYFQQRNLDWIKSTIVGYGDAAPTLLTTAQNFTDPGGNPAPELTTPPSLTPAATGTVLKWSTPTTAVTPSISSFDVTIGKAGVLDRFATVSAGTGNSMTLNNLSANSQYIACVRPRNSIGASSAAQVQMFYSPSWYVLAQTPNCTTIDTRSTQSTVGAVTGSVAQVGSTGLYKVGFQWSATTPVPADLPIRYYRVKQTISYPTGPQRVSTQDVLATASAVSTTKGSKVCTSVAALTDAGQVGPQSAPICVTAN